MGGPFESHPSCNDTMSHCAHIWLALRRFVAVLGVLALMFSGVAHICGHQGAPSADVVVSVDMDGGAAGPDGNMLSAHHCGACVGVVLPQTMHAEAAEVLSATILRTPAHRLVSHDPALHTPPPKSLT